MPRTDRPATIDLRTGAPPENPWLAWALHLAATLAEARGFDPGHRTLNRNLVMMVATHADGDRVHASDFHHVIRNHSGALVHILDVETGPRREGPPRRRVLRPRPGPRPGPSPCDYANICERCPNFRTDAGYVPVLAAQRARNAEARGWGSEAERHRQLIERLDAHVHAAQTG